MTYEELLIHADSENLIVKEKNIPGYGGRIYKNRIAIHKELESSTEKACVLAEELGHYHTSQGNILDQSDTANRKQELKARLWAYNKQIGLMGLVRAYEHGCMNRYEIAKFLEVSEKFLSDAIECYRKKYGQCVVVDNYIIGFEPVLAIAKMS